MLEANLPAETLAAVVAAHAALPPGARPWLVANPASPARAERLAGLLGALDLLICNRAEAEVLAGRRFPDDDVGLGRAQSLARELDVTMASLALFRTGTVGTSTEWEYFYTPDRVDGFCGSPLLPPGAW